MVPEIWSVTDIIFCFLDRFSSFYPHPSFPMDPENQNFEKMKKPPGDIITLHMCTINGNHIMYGFWDIEYDRQNVLLFWTIFFPFYPTNNPKNKNFKRNEINTWIYYHFAQVHHKWQSHDVWFLRFEVQRTEFFVILEIFLPF